MPKYTVKFYSGDYAERQQAANRDGAIFYFEGHANAAANTSADYAMCIVGANHSHKSMKIAQDLAAAWGEGLDVGGDYDADIASGSGVRVGGRGNVNLVHTNMPAVLGEPGFASNPRQARKMETDKGLDTVAHILTEAIRNHFPDGGLIAFSIGHLGKDSAPNDRGAAWAGERFTSEAEFAQVYMNRAAKMLETNTGSQTNIVLLRYQAPNVSLRVLPDWDAIKVKDKSSKVPQFIRSADPVQTYGITQDDWVWVRDARNVSEGGTLSSGWIHKSYLAGYE